MKGDPVKKFVVGMAVLALCLGLIEVEDGRITKCRHCGKEIGNTVQKLNVAPEDAGKYKVVYDVASCALCANLEVTNYVHRICLKCQSEFKKDPVVGRLGEVRADQTLRTDFCQKCADEYITKMDIGLCERCGKGIEMPATGLRGHLPDPQEFDGKIEYMEDCVLIRPAKGKKTFELRLDSRRRAYTATHGDLGIICNFCKTSVKAKDGAKKTGYAAGGVVRALVEGLLEGVGRNE